MSRKQEYRIAKFSNPEGCPFNDNGSCKLLRNNNWKYVCPDVDLDSVQLYKFPAECPLEKVTE